MKKLLLLLLLAFTSCRPAIPVKVRPPHQVIGAMAVEAIIRTQLSADIRDIVIVDPLFSLLAKYEIEEIAAAPLTAKSRYMVDIYDCDDFAMSYKAEIAHRVAFATEIPYALPLGYILATIKLKNGEIVGHAFNLVVDADYKVWFIEPQSGQFFDPKKVNITAVYLIVI